MSTPCGESFPYGESLSRKAVGARGALSAHDRAALRDRCRAALEAARLREEPGCETLEANPWIALLPAVDLARVALEVAEPDVHPAISAKWQRSLDAAVSRMDRYARFGAGQPGAGRAALLDLAAGGWADYLPLDSRPRSLGALAVCAKRLANEWRRHDRARRRRGDQS